MTNATPPPPPPPPLNLGAAAVAQTSVPVPQGTVMTSLAKRFGGSLLTVLLIVVTLGIGYLI